MALAWRLARPHGWCGVKVKIDKSKARDASEVHVVDEASALGMPTPAYCFAKAADELRSKNHPTTVYGYNGGSTQLMYVPDHQSARLWIDLGVAIGSLVES